MAIIENDDKPRNNQRQEHPDYQKNKEHGKKFIESNKLEINKLSSPDGWVSMKAYENAFFISINYKKQGNVSTPISYNQSWNDFDNALRSNFKNIQRLFNGPADDLPF